MKKRVLVERLIRWFAAQDMTKQSVILGLVDPSHAEAIEAVLEGKPKAKRPYRRQV